MAKVGTQNKEGLRELDVFTLRRGGEGETCCQKMPIESIGKVEQRSFCYFWVVRAMGKEAMNLSFKMGRSFSLQHSLLSAREDLSEELLREVSILGDA